MPKFEENEDLRNPLRMDPEELEGLIEEGGELPEGEGGEAGAEPTPEGAITGDL